MKKICRIIIAMLVAVLAMTLAAGALAEDLSVSQDEKICTVQNDAKGLPGVSVEITYLTKHLVNGGSAKVKYTITGADSSLFSNYDIQAWICYQCEGQDENDSVISIKDVQLTKLSGTLSFTIPEDAIRLRISIGSYADHMLSCFQGETNYALVAVDFTPPVMLAHSTLVLYPSQSVQLYPTQTGCTKFTYKSSKAGVVSISSKGKITAKKKGTTTVTVSGKYGKSAKVKVTVKAAPAIHLDDKSATLRVGGTCQLSPTVTLAENAALLWGYSFTYKSSNSKVASVSSDGLITAKKSGTATITVKCSLGSKVTFKVTVKKGN